MVGHIRGRFLRWNPELSRRIKKATHGIEMPIEMRATSDRLAKIRTGIVCAVLFVWIYVCVMAAMNTPSQFLASMTNVGFLLISFLVIPFAAIVLNSRTKKFSNEIVPILQDMLPEDRDDISVKYSERGVADIGAPWICRNPRRMSRKALSLLNILNPIGGLWRRQ